jgi:hypothetical protein
MSDIAILKEMFKTNILEKLENRQEGTHVVYSVKLKEPKDGYFIIIDRMSNDNEVVIINPEAFIAPTVLFNGNKHECKRSDFVIIDEKEKVILYIEMKRTKGSKKDVVAQLRGAKCFVSYCKEIGREFWNEANFLDSYEHRFVVVDHIDNKISKSRHRVTRQDMNTIHNRPEAVLSIPYRDKLKFDNLINLYK